VAKVDARDAHPLAPASHRSLNARDCPCPSGPLQGQGWRWRLAGILNRPPGFRAGIRYRRDLGAWRSGRTGTPSFLVMAVVSGCRGCRVRPTSAAVPAMEKFRNLNVETRAAARLTTSAQREVLGGGTGRSETHRDRRRQPWWDGSRERCLQLPGLFRRGLELYGVVDRALFLRLTPIANSKIHGRQDGRDAAEKPAVYRKANVLPDAAQIRTPLLISTAEQIPGAAAGGPRQFAEALKRAGKTSPISPIGRRARLYAARAPPGRLAQATGLSATVLAKRQLGPGRDWQP